MRSWIILKKNNQKKILSIIVGGTGLYLNTLLNGIANIPIIPEEYKEQSKKLISNIGLNKFYNEVYKIDKSSCGSLYMPNCLVKLIILLTPISWAILTVIKFLDFSKPILRVEGP